MFWRMAELPSVTAADFDSLVGATFDVRPDSFEADALRMVLTAVRRFPGQAGFREPFTLELLGPTSPVAAQGTYRVRHPALGDLDLFMVPVGASPDGATYEITFG